MPNPWPGTLPQYVLAQGYQETAPNNTVRTEMTSEIAKYRENKTASVRPIACSVRLTYAQRATLDTFYNDNSSVPFSWVHPVTRAACEFMFVSPPSYSPAGNSSHIIASLSLELLP